MVTSLLIKTDAWVIAVALFIAMLSSAIIGARIASRKKERFLALGIDKKAAETNFHTGLFFFLLAFTFGMSGTRYDNRRNVIVEEATIIETALLRADLYSPEERLLFRKDFLEYVEARIDYFEARADFEKITDAQERSHEVSKRLWMRATKLSHDPAYLQATLLMCSSLNEMIDITTTRLAGENARVPESILWMLFALACINSFFSGYSSTLKGTLDWLVEAGFCLLITLVVLFILDIDRPRRGLVTLDSVSQNIVDLRRNFISH